MNSFHPPQTTQLTCFLSLSQKPAPSWDPMEAAEAVTEIVQQGKEGEKLELFDTIGSGSFGTVYQDRWRNLGVAVKVWTSCERSGVVR
jgi:hypothetical protein